MTAFKGVSDRTYIPTLNRDTTTLASFTQTSPRSTAVNLRQFWSIGNRRGMIEHLLSTLM
jgi:hypothetical protein